MAIRRAGQYLQLAILEARLDTSTPPELRVALAGLTPLANRMEDVPTPTVMVGDPTPMAIAATTCVSCGVGRILTPLSPPACPSCGVVPEVTAM